MNEIHLFIEFHFHFIENVAPRGLQIGPEFHMGSLTQKCTCSPSLIVVQTDCFRPEDLHGSEILTSTNPSCITSQLCGLELAPCSCCGQLIRISILQDCHELNELFLVKYLGQCLVISKCYKQVSHYYYYNQKEQQSLSFIRAKEGTVQGLWGESKYININKYIFLKDNIQYPTTKSHSKKSSSLKKKKKERKPPRQIYENCWFLKNCFPVKANSIIYVSHTPSHFPATSLRTGMN